MLLDQAGAGLAEHERQRSQRQMLSLPTRDQIEVPPFNEALIVEYYSR